MRGSTPPQWRVGSVLDARELVVHRLDPGGWVRTAAFVATEPGTRARIEPSQAEEAEIATLFGDDPSD